MEEIIVAGLCGVAIGCWLSTFAFIIIGMKTKR